MAARAQALLLTAGCIVLLSAAQAQSGAGQSKSLYRWTDAQGMTHYGDSVPASAAQQARAQLDRNGRVRRVLPASQPEDQRQAAALAQSQAKRRQDYDQFLLQTYASARDIEAARDQQLASIDRRIANARQIAQQNQRTRNELDAQTPVGSDGTELKKSRDGYAAAAKQDQSVLDDLHAQRDAVMAHYASDLHRYQQLRGTNPAGVAAPDRGKGDAARVSSGPR